MPIMEYDFNFVRSLLVPIVAEPLPQMDASLLRDCERLVRIIDAMTEIEREDCDLLLDAKRRERIARDSQVSIAEVNQAVAMRQVMAIGFSQMFRRK